MTPSMAMSVRALEAIPFVGAMRRAYVKARGIELLCEMWAQIAPAAPQGATTRLDARTLSRVERARVFIDENYSASLTVPALARAVGTNEANLSRGFRVALGLSVGEYVRSKRMEEARRRLRTGRQSITEIALDVGYEYPCNFTVAYKKYFGLTPREERIALA
jgi:AraC-like DNA-binding protein